MKRKIYRASCKPNGSRRLIAIMAGIIILLAIVLAYAFAVKPAFNGYVVEKQVEAQDIVLNALLSQLSQNGYIQIPLSDGKVLVLVEYQYPEQQANSQIVEQ